MKTKVVTFTNTPENAGHKQLIRSLNRWVVDYHVINAPWVWFGTKIVETAAYVRTIQDEYTHFMFVDGHDTFFQLPTSSLRLSEGDDKFEKAAKLGGWIKTGLVSTEKACWPDPKLAEQYPKVETNSRWIYLNSGSYIFSIPFFLKMVEENPLTHFDDDQLWLTKIYLNGQPFKLDTECTLFQSIAFLADDEFDVLRLSHWTRVMYNRITDNSIPMVIHNNGGNAKNPMQWIYDLIL